MRPLRITLVLDSALRSLLSSIISVTEKSISAMPRAMRGVSTSPKISMPKTAAVTGSSAPIIAVGVEPMH